MMCTDFPLYYFYLLVAVRFDIAFNKHILCVRIVQCSGVVVLASSERK